jgi:uncharacterized iron-regulated membrane protein
MRAIAVVLHRCVGLTIAAFLFVSGVTGAVISWDHELDAVLNPHLTAAPGWSQPGAVPQDPLRLAKTVAASDPRAIVAYVPMQAEPGESLAFGVSPRSDPATHAPYTLGYNQVFVDPITGAILGKRLWGAAWPLSTETFVSFLYVLHYSLHIPALWGIDRWGVWLMGGIAILWMLDCFVGFYLTLPLRKRPAAGRPVPSRRTRLAEWCRRFAPAWAVKWRGSAYRINFDLHRAFSLWTWAVLFLLALSAAALNLNREVTVPLVSVFSRISPTPFDVRPFRSPAELGDPKIGFPVVIDLARAEAKRRGIAAPLGDVFYSPWIDAYGVRFFAPGGDHGDGVGLLPPVFYFDGSTGNPAGTSIPWQGSAGDVFLQLQFPVHSGRILGIGGRVFVSAMGLGVAMLSVTGVVIWWRKRRARLASRRSASIAPHRGAAPASAE